MFKQSHNKKQCNIQNRDKKPQSKIRKRSTPPIHKGHHNSISCPVCMDRRRHGYIDTGISVVDLISSDHVIKWISANEMVGTVREAYVYKKLGNNNPNLCTLDSIQFDAKGQRYGLVLKRAAGDLDHYIICQSFREQIGEITAEQLLYDILRLLVDLHNVGIVHRDIKPGNILVFPSESKDLNNNDSIQRICPRICLTDFGNSSITYGLDDTIKFTDGVCTIVYAPPEDSSGILDSRFDMYCLASTVLHFIMFPYRCQQLGNIEDHLHYIANNLGKQALSNLLAQMLHIQASERPTALEALKICETFEDIVVDYTNQSNTTQNISSLNYNSSQNPGSLDNNFIPNPTLAYVGFSKEIKDIEMLDIKPNIDKIKNTEENINADRAANIPNTMEHLLWELCNAFQLRPCGFRTVLRMFQESKSKNTFLQPKRNITKKQGLWAACTVAVVACCTETHGFIPEFAAEFVIEYMETHVQTKFKTPISRAFQSNSIMLCTNVILTQFDYLIPVY